MEQLSLMERAIELAKQGKGKTSPNPMVGAVLVKKNRIIGEGFHEKCGKKHAEITAIENASEPVSGSVLYCNLEPCCHDTPEKRTPPCTSRIIKEGIRSVYIATLDPNPLVSGKGLNVLQAAGIDVHVGLLADEAARLNETYFKFIRTRQPFVHLKMAVSLDNRIATQAFDSKWITDSAARKRVHNMRSAYDAVLIGSHTANIDDPQLTVRLTTGKQPLRVVLDSHLHIPLSSRLLKDSYRNKTHIFTTATHDMEKRKFIEEQDVNVHVVDSDKWYRPDLASVLNYLGRMGVASVLVEGGAAVFTEFIQRSLFDKISMFIAPVIIGKGVDAIGQLNIQKIKEAIRLENIRYEQINQQMLVEGYREMPPDYSAYYPKENKCLQELSKSLVK